MKVVSSVVGVRALKTKLSAYLDSVKEGHDVVVTEREGSLPELFR